MGSAELSCKKPLGVLRASLAPDSTVVPHSSEKVPGKSPEAMYFMPAISRCLLDGATNRALPSAYTLPCGLSLRVPFIHNFLPSIRSSSMVASSNLPGMTSTFCRPSTQTLLKCSLADT